MNKSIIVVGLIVLIVIISMWTSALSDIKVGHFMLGHYAIEQANVERSNINTTYGLFAAVVLIGVPVLAHLYKQGNKQKDEEK